MCLSSFLEGSFIDAMATKGTLQPNVDPLDIEGNSSNLAQAWSEWHKSFKLYLTAADLDDATDKRKVALLLSLIGKQGMVVFNSFSVNEDTIAFTELVKKFEKHFTPKKNLTVERHKFLSRRQKPAEPIDDFATDLKNLSLSCELGTLREDLVKDVLIVGLTDSKLKERLLLEADLKLDKALEICKSYQMTHTQLKCMQNAEESPPQQQVNAVQQSGSEKSEGPRNALGWRRGQPSWRPFQRGRGQRFPSESTNRSGRYRSQSRERTQGGTSGDSECDNCGLHHRYRCPARGQQCDRCLEYDHYARRCKKNLDSKQAVRMLNADRQQDSTGQHDDGEDLEYFVCKLNCNNSDPNEVWTVDVSINGVTIPCQLDTGAQTNCLSFDEFTFLQLDPGVIKPSATRITSFCGSEVPNRGSAELECLIRGKLETVRFNIINKACPAVLGLKTCQHLGLVQRVLSVNSDESNLNYNKIQGRYRDVFKGLGCMPQVCSLKLKPDFEPVIDPPRKLPFKLYSRVKAELDRMERDGVVEKVTEPTEWVSSMVVTERRSGALRICLDPKNLNKNLMRSHYQLPTFSEIRSELSGSTVYSTLDANSGFWIIPVDEKSSKLLTFNTPFGRFRFKRLPFGISVAPEIFHRTMMESFGDLPGVKIFLDDLLVHGPTKQIHDERLESVLKRAVDLNVKFNKEKCVFGLDKVKYMGHIFSGQGVQIDNSRIRAVCEMPVPEDKTALMKFLGMVNYVSSFVPNLAEETSVLRDLTKPSTQWQWQPHHQKAFEELKKLITKAPVLAHFDVKAPIVLTVDSSRRAVGAAILQNGKPIAYSSKTLSSTQQNYAQIEKEMYAVVHGCTKFRQYIWGQKITVETDHSPLVSIYKRPLAKVPVRLQRMLLQLQCYDIDLVHKAGKYMFIADTLSRAPLPDVDDYLDKEIALHVNLVRSSFAVRPETIDKIKEAINTDEELKMIIAYCHNGWPDSKTQVAPLVKPYWSFREELNMIDGLVCRNDSIIIPKKLRNEIISIIHESHMGLERTLAMVRGVLYWPNLTGDIKNLIESCATCLSHKRQNTKEPLEPHEVPTLPWQKVAADFLSFDQKMYLVVVDYYSKFIEMVNVTKNNAFTVINCFKSIFSRFGIPVQLVTDGGPPFSSVEFQNFVKSWKIQHVKSSPYHPKSNGMAESAVKIMKNLLSKCKQSGTDLCLALLHQRNTPKGEMASPAQLLMSRRLNCTLPINNKLLQPKVVSSKHHLKVAFKRQNDSKLYYDKISRALSELHVGDEIHFKRKPNEHWIPGTVVKLLGRRSYIVKSLDGSEYCRNRVHLLAKPGPIIKSKQHIVSNRFSASNIPSYCNYTEDKITLSPNRSPNGNKSPNTQNNKPHDTPESQLEQKSNSPNQGTNVINEDQSLQTNDDVKTTRSGRTTKPPQRFTFSDFD